MTPWVKKLTILLALSAGLNAFLLGVVVMGFVRGPGPGHGHGVGLHGGGSHGRHDKDAWRGSKELRQLFRSKGPELKEARRSLQVSRGRVRDALGAEPFDAQRLTRELAALRADTTRSQESVHAALVEAASRMSLEERRRLDAFEGRRHLGD